VDESRRDFDQLRSLKSRSSLLQPTPGGRRIRPRASIEYSKLHEKGFTETGEADAYDLAVRARDSKETAANALLAGYDFMRSDDQEWAWLRLELEGGRRQI
jgi:hypothetical protein